MPARDEKISLRIELARRQQEFSAKEKASAEIVRIFLGLPLLARVQTIMLYVHTAEEVRTRDLLHLLLQKGKRVAIPWCDGPMLRPVLIAAVEELSPGTFGIEEPAAALRSDPARLVEPGALELIVIPGVGFDRHGTRLGRGVGYYDRFLPLVSPSCVRLGFSFSSQLVEFLPREAHDQEIDALITEEGLLTFSKRSS